MDNLYFLVAIPSDLIDESGVDITSPIAIFAKDSQIVIENHDDSIYDCLDDCDDFDGCRACRCHSCRYGDTAYSMDRKRGAQ